MGVPGVLVKGEWVIPADQLDPIYRRMLDALCGPNKEADDG